MRDGDETGNSHRKHRGGGGAQRDTQTEANEVYKERKREKVEKMQRHTYIHRSR